MEAKERGGTAPYNTVVGKRYIVYPDGALSWEEIKATVELLKEEGNSPKIVKYKGLWNVEAGVKVSE